MAEVLNVISNVTLLLDAYAAYKFRRIFRAPVFFVEAIVSALYHLCDYSGRCIFAFSMLHNLDFFFAQLLIVDAVLYLVNFKKGYMWVEWIMFFIGMLAIVVLEYALPDELFVQAGIAGVMALILITYWFIWGVPHYDWFYFSLGLSLIGGSILLFTFQGTWPEAYWSIHSLWHTLGPIGRYYLFYVKAPANIVDNAANKVRV